MLADGFNAQFKNDSILGVGGRLGWLAFPTLLTYFSGGYTQAHFNSVSFLTQPMRTSVGLFQKAKLEVAGSWAPATNMR